MTTAPVDPIADLHATLEAGLADIKKSVEAAAAPAETFHIELEASTDDILLESGDYLLLEGAP